MLALLWKRSSVLLLFLPVGLDVVGTNRLYDLLFLHQHRRVGKVRSVVFLFHFVFLLLTLRPYLKMKVVVPIPMLDC